MHYSFWELPLSVRAAILFLFLISLTPYASSADLKQLFAAADSVSPVLVEARLDLARALADYQTSCGMPNPTLFGSRESVSNDQANEVELTFGVLPTFGLSMVLSAQTCCCQQCL